MITRTEIRELNLFTLAAVVPRHQGSRRGELENALIRMLDTDKALQSVSTQQEMICRLGAEGYTQAEISRELGSSLRTVSRQVTALREQLDLPDSFFRRPEWCIRKCAKSNVRVMQSKFVMDQSVLEEEEEDEEC